MNLWHPRLKTRFLLYSTLFWFSLYLKKTKKLKIFLQFHNYFFSSTQLVLIKKNIYINENVNKCDLGHVIIFMKWRKFKIHINMLPFTLVSCNVKYNQTIYFPLFYFSPKYPIFDEMQFYSIPYLINYSYEITLYIYFKLRENRESRNF